MTINGTPLPSPASTVCVKDAPHQPYREVLWHLDASKLVLTNQHFEGFQDITTGDGKKVTVMAVHADQVDLTDMVTYSANPLAPDKRVYSNGGAGKNVHLTNVTLHVLKQTGVVYDPFLGIRLGEVTLGPPGIAGTDPVSIVTMALLESNVPLPPAKFTDVHVDQYLMTADTLSIPGFNVHPQP